MKSFLKGIGFMILIFNILKVTANDSTPKDDASGNSLQFIISKVDIEENNDLNHNPLGTIPIIMPAKAYITLPSPQTEKNKKNFSKIAKSLMSGSRIKAKKPLVQSTPSVKLAKVKLTTVTVPVKVNTTSFKVFEMTGFCNSKADGLYDDPDDCENFIICFANRTFRTKCAYGTLWNHIRKECDYPGKVDCNRVPTTVETTTTTTRTTSRLHTIVVKPKLSVLTVKPPVVDPVDEKAAKLNSNIIIASIVIPGAVFLIVAIVLTLWYWNKKFKIQNRKIELSRLGRTQTVTKEDEIAIHPNNKLFFNKLSSCCCYKRLAYLAAYHKQFRPKMIGSCSLSAKEDRIRTQPNQTNQTNIETNLTKDLASQVSFPMENQGYIQETPEPTHIVLNECSLANESHATLSSHFEENNWDYNFATRGLYLSQPWAKGRYIHTLGSESIATSGVLTLDPTIDIGGEINVARLAESDTDGYYA